MITIRPERREDIPFLADHFIAGMNKKTGKAVAGLSKAALRIFMDYSWPGNVRELENVMERLVVLVRTGRVEVKDLPTGIREGMSDARLRSAPGTLQELERGRIIDALDQAHGNKKLAAKRLGIHRSTLYAKLRRYGLLDVEHAGQGNGSGAGSKVGQSG